MCNILVLIPGQNVHHTMNSIENLIVFSPPRQGGFTWLLISTSQAKVCLFT